MPNAQLANLFYVEYVVVNKAITGSDNGLSPDRRQTIFCTKAGILFIGPLRINFSAILIKIEAFLLNKMRLKMSPVKWRPFCLLYS